MMRYTPVDRARHKMVYLAPIFTPAVGGGVVYLELLSGLLADSVECGECVILTESYPGMPSVEISHDGRVRIVRRFPFRAGRSRKDIFSYAAYFLQNLQFLKIPFYLRSTAADVLVVHGSFLNNPTTLWFVLRMVRALCKEVRVIADMRDPKLPPKKLPLLEFFDRIISCSKNITDKLTAISGLRQKICEIPIIVDVERASQEEIDAVVLKYGLSGVEYVFNGSGVSLEKGIEHLSALIAEIRTMDRKVLLVVAGKRRSWGEGVEKAEREGWLKYLGPIPHYDALALSAGAWLDVNLSSVDSMPRHSLEALLAGARVLLPKGVPEFDEECPDFVANNDSLQELAKKSIAIAEGRLGGCGYDVTRHLPDNVVNDYIRVLFGESV